MRLPFTAKSVAAKTIAQMVGGVDYFVIGIALLIFGYGIYELVISDLNPQLEGGEEQHTNILSVNSLQSLKNNLSNVIVVGLIVAAFKKPSASRCTTPLIYWRCVSPWPCWPSVLG